MTLAVPPTTRAILDAFDADRQPTADHEIAGNLTGLHRADGLTDEERTGAWAEFSAFEFHLTEKESPWGTDYGPAVEMPKQDGTPFYTPDITDIDEEIVAHWEHRSEEATHPVLRARYADIVWDLKEQVTKKRANVQFAQRAIDAYLDGITEDLFKAPLYAAWAGRRALRLASRINDKDRIERCNNTMLDLFETNLLPDRIGIWVILYDSLTENKKTTLTPEETDRLVQGLERMLTTHTTPGDGFDPHGAEAAARRLAAHYERQGNKAEAQRAIRSYGKAFEELAAQAGPMMGMAWLQPVHDEYKNRGMTEDAARVLATSADKGKNVAQDLKEVRVPLEFSEEELEQLAEDLTQGSPRDALLRIAVQFIPKTDGIKEQLQQMRIDAPLMALMGVTLIVDDRFAAQAGSIEADLEGRLVMQLAQHIDIYNIFLSRTLDHLRTKGELTTDAILEVLYESPVFTEERRPLLREGITAYLDGDHTKAIHVIVPQIEQALRQLLTLIGVPTLKAGRKGLMQVKNLNDILREPAVNAALGEDIRLYLLTFLADERGHNIRNTMCHGLAAREQFNQQLANQTVHALLAVALRRAKTTPPDAQPTNQDGGAERSLSESPPKADGE